MVHVVLTSFEKQDATTFGQISETETGEPYLATMTNGYGLKV